MYVPPLEIQPTEVLAGCIAVYKDVWKNPYEDIAAIEKITSDPLSGIAFKKAKTAGELAGRDPKTVGALRTNQDLSLTTAATTNEVFRNINNKFFEIVYSAATNYAKTIGLGQPVFFVEEFNLLKYQTGQEYTAHADGVAGSVRSISPILYLNDDYTGGELEFVNFNLKIKPIAGTLYLFPPFYPYGHIAHPVISGTKYAIVTWLHDVPSVN